MSKTLFLTQKEADELILTVHTIYVLLKTAENTDKTILGRLKFWSDEMNDSLSTARSSIETVLRGLEENFRSSQEDTVEYELPGELYAAVTMLSRLRPNQIKNVSRKLKNRR